LTLPPAKCHEPLAAPRTSVVPALSNVPVMLIESPLRLIPARSFTEKFPARFTVEFVRFTVPVVCQGPLRVTVALTLSIRLRFTQDALRVNDPFEAHEMVPSFWRLLTASFPLLV